MNLLCLCSYLWTKTRKIKVSDLESIYLQGEKNPYLWQKKLKNLDLKNYLDLNPNWPKECKRELLDLQRRRIGFSFWKAPNYPKIWEEMDFPPLFITYLGNLDLIYKKSLSIVGSRMPSEASHEWMSTYLYYYLKESQVCVVSGAARGVDQVSHEIAKWSGCDLIAILPSGLGRLYPQSYQKIIQEVNEKKYLLISEYAWDAEMRKYYFQQRNRLIASLSKVLLVVEARRRSGSLITARYALDMGKEVCTLPSCAMDMNRIGSLDLIYDGAKMIRDHQDLADIMS